MRPTLQDIARDAKVSTATVDRVLNGRDGVRPRTRDRVLAVARRIGYLADDLATTPAPVRLHVLLPDGTNAFIRDLPTQIAELSAQMAGVTATVEAIASLDPDVLSARLDMLHGTTDGVALVALDHPVVRAALGRLIASGCPVVTLISDIHGVQRLAYAGIDNGQAGRLAGYVLGRFIARIPQPKVAFFAGSLAYRGHQEREMGFRQILAEEFGDGRSGRAP